MSTELATTDKEFYPQIRSVLGAEAAPDAVLDTAIAYCQAAGLDIMRKPVAIISYSGKHQIVFTIQAITTIASRAGWAGSDEIVFSDKMVTIDGVSLPEWGSQVVYKMISGHRCAFAGPKVYLRERHKNSWKQAGSMAMLQKCVTAAALRLAFPEALAHAYTEEEMPYQAQVPVDNTGIEKLKAIVSEPAPVVLETEEVKVDDLDSIRDAVNGAVTLEELKAIGEAIKAYGLEGDTRTEMIKLYRGREKELKNNG